MGLLGRALRSCGLLALLAAHAAFAAPTLARNVAEARQMALGRFADVPTAKAAVDVFTAGRDELSQLSQVGRDYDLNNVEIRMLCEAGCATLGAIVGDAEAVVQRDAARDAGAIQHIIQTCLTEFHSTESVCEECVGALHAMAKRSNGKEGTADEGMGSLEQMFELDVVRMLVMAVEMYPHSRSIAGHGVHLLVALTLHEHFVCPERLPSCLSKQAVVDSGAIAAIGAALQHFPGESHVQQWGILALRALGDADLILAADGQLGLHTFDVVIARPEPGHMDWVVKTRNLLADEGSIALAVVAMELHPGESRLQEEGCWLLSMMSTHTVEQKEAARSAGAMGVAVAAMQAHLDKPWIQAACLSPLIAMMGPSGWVPDAWDATGSAVSDSGALESLTKRNELYSLVQGRLASPDDTAWKELACDPDYQSPGIVETIAEAMRRHPQDTRLQHAGCVALGTLVSPAQPEGEQVCKREARAAGVPKLVVDALNANRGVKQVAVECTKALSELIGTPRMPDRFLARDLLQMGGLRETVAVMNTDNTARAELHAGTLSTEALNHYLSIRRINCCTSLRNMHAGGDDLHKLMVEHEEWWKWCENHAKMGNDVDRLGFAFGQVLGYAGMAMVIYLPWRAWSRGRNRRGDQKNGTSWASVVGRCQRFFTGRDVDVPQATPGKRRRKLKKHARE